MRVGAGPFPGADLILDPGTYLHDLLSGKLDPDQALADQTFEMVGDTSLLRPPYGHIGGSTLLAIAPMPVVLALDAQASLQRARVHAQGGCDVGEAAVALQQTLFDLRAHADAEHRLAGRVALFYEAGRQFEELRIAIVTWIERTYHRRRRQAALGRLTPIDFGAIMTTPASQAA